VARSRLDGLIHYTQSFCFRQIQDRLLRQHLNLPILTIEGDRPSPLDHRTRLRLEAFVDVLLVADNTPWSWADFGSRFVKLAYTTNFARFGLKTGHTDLLSRLLPQEP
jgi:hypothetical protein